MAPIRTPNSETEHTEIDMSKDGHDPFSNYHICGSTVAAKYVQNLNITSQPFLRKRTSDTQSNLLSSAAWECDFSTL